MITAAPTMVQTAINTTSVAPLAGIVCDGADISVASVTDRPPTVQVKRVSGGQGSAGRNCRVRAFSQVKAPGWGGPTVAYLLGSSSGPPAAGPVSASKKMVVVTDSSKQVTTLGKFPLPVEVIGFAEPLVAKKISDLGARVVRRLNSAGKPYITDEGHHILDCHFGRIDDPPALNARLCDLPGIVEHGLFIGMASVVLMAKAGAVEELRR